MLRYACFIWMLFVVYITNSNWHSAFIVEQIISVTGDFITTWHSFTSFLKVIEEKTPPVSTAAVQGTLAEQPFTRLSCA